MKISVKLKGTSPYSQSKFYVTVPNEGESRDAFERRSWKDKAHYNKDGFVVVPTFALKTMLDSVAMYLGIAVPGDGKRTFSKIIRSGVSIQAEAPLLICSGKKITEKDLVPEWINANADGKRGSGKRVPRCFPVFMDWSIDIEFEVLDPRITLEVFLKHLVCAGQYIGIGRFRPESGGSNGRFSVFYSGKEQKAVEIQKRVDDKDDE
jgi:hypothetical protein